jgi:hypothetical protein
MNHRIAVLATAWVLWTSLSSAAAPQTGFPSRVTRPSRTVSGSGTRRSKTCLLAGSTPEMERLHKVRARRAGPSTILIFMSDIGSTMLRYVCFPASFDPRAR